MKFLFDENISATLPASLADIFPDSRHVREVAMKGAVDEAVWAYAFQHGFTLVSKDDDFREMSVLRGAPPKLVMINLGNCATSTIAALLRDRQTQLAAFEQDQSVAIIELP